MMCAMVDGEEKFCLPLKKRLKRDLLKKRKLKSGLRRRRNERRNQLRHRQYNRRLGVATLSVSVNCTNMEQSACSKYQAGINGSDTRNILVRRFRKLKISVSSTGSREPCIYNQERFSNY